MKPSCYFNMGENKIYLYKNATPSTVAHELFHKIDNDNSISVSGILDDCIRSDYERLVKKAEKAGQNLEDMLFLKYPEYLAPSEYIRIPLPSFIFFSEYSP